MHFTLIFFYFLSMTLFKQLKRQLANILNGFMVVGCTAMEVKKFILKNVEFSS